MKISQMSCTEILIISLTIMSSIGLTTYFYDTRTSGHQAHEAQKQVLTERAIAFEKAKNSLIDLITQHMKSPIFKEKSIRVSSKNVSARAVQMLPPKMLDILRRVGYFKKI